MVASQKREGEIKCGLTAGASLPPTVSSTANEHPLTRYRDTQIFVHLPKEKEPDIVFLYGINSHQKVTEKQREEASAS